MLWQGTSSEESGSYDEPSRSIRGNLVRDAIRHTIYEVYPRMNAYLDVGSYERIISSFGSIK